MDRPKGLPQVGTTIHDPTFAGGCTMRVKKVLPPFNGNVAHGKRGWRVSVEIAADDGRLVKPPVRCWSLTTWLATVERAALDATQEKGNG